jgi:restriction system protein
MSPALILVILIAIAMAAAWWSLVIEKRNADWDTLVVINPAARDLQEKLIKLSTLIAAEHARALYIKSKQLIATDAYGNRDMSRYYEEITYFMMHVVIEDERFIELARSNPDIADAFISSVCGIGRGTLRIRMGEEIMEFVDCYPELTNMVEQDWETANPIEFEALCAGKVESAGWDAQLTKASGDQGADVICHKNGISIVLQCKLYSSPIGNKAVQEAFAAKSFYGLDHAAVVSNQPYTKSANELAAMTGVLLLHIHDLDQLDDPIAARPLK